MIEDFVNDVINKHIVRYNLLFGFVISSEIRKYVKEGVYAFQLIYNENQQVILVKPLDWAKVIQNSLSDAHYGQKLWSYDGGEKFQYSSIETLKLDIQKIRELKLDNILA
jgi:hypothetical protein